MISRKICALKDVWIKSVLNTTHRLFLFNMKAMKTFFGILEMKVSSLFLGKNFLFYFLSLYKFHSVLLLSFFLFSTSNNILIFPWFFSFNLTFHFLALHRLRIGYFLFLKITSKIYLQSLYSFRGGVKVWWSFKRMSQRMIGEGRGGVWARKPIEIISVF